MGTAELLRRLDRILQWTSISSKGVVVVHLAALCQRQEPIRNYWELFFPCTLFLRWQNAFSFFVFRLVASGAATLPVDAQITPRIQIIQSIVWSWRRPRLQKLLKFCWNYVDPSKFSCRVCFAVGETSDSLTKILTRITRRVFDCFLTFWIRFLKLINNSLCDIGISDRNKQWFYDPISWFSN